MSDRVDAPSSASVIPARTALAVAVLVASVAALTFAFQTSASLGFYSLFAVPVAVAARRLGLAAGVVVALTTLGIIQAHALVEGVPLGFGGIVTRSAALVAVAVLAAPRLPAATTSGRAGPLGRPAAERLTPREVEVLRLLALGNTNAEVAEELCLSVRTVESHRARLQRKLARRGRAELTAYALREGLIRPGEVSGRPEPARSAGTNGRPLLPQTGVLTRRFPDRFR